MQKDVIQMLLYLQIQESPQVTTQANPVEFLESQYVHG